VKACLGTVRSEHRPTGLLLRAIHVDEAHSQPALPSMEIPIRATWVEVWRAIHRVHAAGACWRRTMTPDLGSLGIAVEPLPRDRRGRERARR